MNTAFASALMGASPPASSDIINTGNRFNIYRNNYLAGLIHTLSAKFPVTNQLVGTEYFEAIAHSYVVETPPSSPLLDHYGRDFPEFLETIAPLNPPAYLPDVARLEWARSIAPRTTFQPATQITNREDLESSFEIRFQLRPGASLISSAYPVGTIWDHHQFEPVAPVPEWVPEDVAIWWYNGKIHQNTVLSDVFPILIKVANGTPFRQCLHTITNEQKAVHFIGAFTSLVTTGLLIPKHSNMELEHEVSY